jgi:DNA-binding response OmpR family regulator
VRPASGERRILVVEDEALILMMVEDVLAAHGYEPVAAPTLGVAVPMARNESFLGAYLDIKIGGGTVYPVADILRDRRIPFLLATGCEGDEIPPKYRDVPPLYKPFCSDELCAAIRKLHPSDHAAT